MHCLWFVHCTGSRTPSSAYPPIGTQQTILRSQKAQASSTGKVLPTLCYLDGLNSVCVHACMCACVRACVCVCKSVLQLAGKHMFLAS